MLLLRLWNYIRGYVIIIVEGYFLEKFINICIHRQIFLWDIKKRNNITMMLKVSIKGFRLLRPIARKTDCRVRIYRKRGVPFILNRYRGRKTFVLGAVVFIILVYVLSSFVWSIEVSGNNKLQIGAVLERLAQIGVKPGVLKYKIDTDYVANSMMLDIKELAWIGVAVKGTKIKIELVERVQPPELIPKDKPCNIVAARDGVIKAISAKTGQEMVKAGDTVIKGQLLISGNIPNKNEKEPPRLVHAIGNIKARTWYEKRCNVSTKVMETKKTGRTKDNYSIVLFNRNIGLFPGKAPFEEYERVEIEKNLSIGQDYIFPFGLKIERFVESNSTEKEIGIDEAKRRAADIAHKEVLKEIAADAEAINTELDFVNTDDGNLEAKVTVECLEEIGTKVEIGGN